MNYVRADSGFCNASKHFSSNSLKDNICLIEIVNPTESVT